jgi:hypothetical protein
MKESETRRIKLELNPETMKELDELKTHIESRRIDVLRRFLIEVLRNKSVSDPVVIAQKADVSLQTIYKLQSISVQDAPAGIVEQTPFQSVFLSYGGPDEPFARKLFKEMTDRDIKVFFFPETATPGQRLHRTMSEGIHEYERVLLICSANSLDRPGVVNEIEQVLAREAREGGAELLMPITIDDYVFKRWNPSRVDIARQVRDRVVIDFSGTEFSPKKFQDRFDRILKALSRIQKQ